MKTRWFVAVGLCGAFVLFWTRQLSTEPSFNGNSPGCTGGGCHTLSGSIVSAQVTNLNVAVTVSGTTDNVGGELVDMSGTVVAVNNSTGSNPFTLTAPSPGTYRVNAGAKSPTRTWDSLMVILGTATGVVDERPFEVALYQNYPNPFNPRTTIRYVLSRRAHVTLTVFNSLAQQVAVLQEGLQPAGHHDVIFDGTDLASGVFLYKIQIRDEAGISSDGFTETRKLLLVR